MSDSDDRTFRGLDRTRQAAGVTAAELCRRAGVDVTTYCRRRKAPDGGTTETLTKWWRALAEIEAERRAAGP